MSAIRNFAAATMMVGAAALATAAFASGPTLTDSQYLAAAHCQGLYNAKSLGPTDASSINQVMKREGVYRSPEIADRADEVRNQAMSVASHAGAGARADLISERDGACQVWARSGSPTLGAR